LIRLALGDRLSRSNVEPTTSLRPHGRTAPWEGRRGPFGSRAPPRPKKVRHRRISYGPPPGERPPSLFEWCAGGLCVPPSRR